MYVWWFILWNAFINLRETLYMIYLFFRISLKIQQFLRKIGPLHFSTPPMPRDLKTLLLTTINSIKVTMDKQFSEFILFIFSFKIASKFPFQRPMFKHTKFSCNKSYYLWKISLYMPIYLHMWDNRKILDQAWFCLYIILL